MPYYEFMWFAKEWVEYIDAKIKRHQEQEAEMERERKKYASGTKPSNFKMPGK